MISPRLAHDALLADIAAARKVTASGDAFAMWWLGQSGFLVQWAQKHLLFDPYLSDSLTRKYAATDKPHVRMMELCCDPRRLDFVDVVTSSHNHTDHLDAETLGPLLEVNREVAIVVPAANEKFVADRLKVPTGRLTTCDLDAPVTIAGFTIYAVPAAHESLDRDELGRHLYLGYVVKFGPFAMYHSGDTVRYDGMAERLRPFEIDVALLPINGRGPERRVSGNLWGREAAQLASDIGARVVVPCHYDMFTFNTASPDEFVAACRALNQQHAVLQCGERFWYRGAPSI
jgi:L-ascorbate metabolism protein UlaG (beta-lactamase superfamily)